MLPFLKFLSDDKEHSLKETIEHVSKEFDFSNEEKNSSCILDFGKTGFLLYKRVKNLINMRFHYN